MSMTPRNSFLIGLIGQGVSPSLTPAMHELEGSRHRMRYLYRTIEFGSGMDPEARLSELVQAARTFGFNGLNLTYPVKQLAIPLLDDLSQTARTVGAVNTVVWDEGRLVGHNTDISGFKAALIDALGDSPQGRIILVGAGGAGSAVAHALAMQGVESLTVVDVDLDRARSLAETVSQVHRQPVTCAPMEALMDLMSCAEGLVNATPIGMAHHPYSPVDVELLRSTMWVCDIVYRPVETPLLVSARERGCVTVSGLGMAMHQAAEAFEIFTGVAADRHAMLTDLKNLVAAENALSSTTQRKDTAHVTATS